jgi:uncharacterized membrane protein
MIKLVGILVVALGFGLRLNTLLVVVVAGLATGMVAGVPFNDVVEQFGRYFIENRYVTLPVVLMLPVVGLLERHGLRERAETLIKRVKAATPGRVLLCYTAMRQISVALGVNIGGHAAMVRPLVAPMAEAAARTVVEAAAPTGSGEVSPSTVESIRAHSAAAENVGNFFGEDTIFAVSGVLLIKGVLADQGREVNLWTLSLWGVPTALVAFGCMWWRARKLDRRVRREAKRKTTAEVAR